ncbi:helix-turn-helix domain-containing protein [Salisediminibacterium selenitireducens]|uniref:Two component transcriptional regulator, AraC family n=1 Tax=Bacillus selenitireducens (strain ATCC 700615 / DSM 15326 / MLS10) TaxID=439292 RepID=D6XZ35_BACIE|nr:AraC family transcriptional regulator [Salisediminibacterium selenitireducens]ADI00320.1 two component transcriptional regulator, AraC family [[Bacillus] selenitireducens MLS10]
MSQVIIAHIEQPDARKLGDFLSDAGVNGYRFLQSGSGKEIIDTLKSAEVHVLITGTNLVKEGQVRTVLEASACPSFRIVLVADQKREDLIREGLAEGASAVIRTPIDVRDVRKALDPLKTPGTIHQIKTYIDEHYDQPLTLKAIAGRFYLNHVYLGQLFKDTFGVLYKDYLVTVRVQHARRLLSQTDCRIEEIAERTGFGSPEYFTERFDKVTGMTPARYRKQFRERTG